MWMASKDLHVELLLTCFLIFHQPQSKRFDMVAGQPVQNVFAANKE